jgi:hypothetical protein
MPQKPMKKPPKNGKKKVLCPKLLEYGEDKWRERKKRATRGEEEEEQGQRGERWRG